jgi:hypothetical protein
MAFGLRDQRAIPAECPPQLRSGWRFRGPVKMRLALAIGTTEAPEHQRRFRHRADLGRPLMLTPLAAGVPDGLQTGIPSQVVDVPVWAHGPVAMLADAGP